MQIRDKVALITGASEGIGAACVAAFRKRGARLSLVARSADKLRVTGGLESAITVGDLTIEETREEAIAKTIERYGRIDILINNAGVGVYGPSWSAPMAETRTMFELNLFAPWRLAQLAAPHMQRQRSGMIVNVSSIAGKVTLPWFTMYSASKYALCSWSDGLRMELNQYGIHVMTVCPGYVRTSFQKNILAGTVPESVAGSNQFIIQPEQCADAIARGVERDSRTVVTPRTGWFFIAAARLLPRFVDAQLERIAASHSRQGGVRAA